MPSASAFSWTPYAPPPGSYVELFADGSFQLEGHDTPFTQDEAVALHNPALAATKEPGLGKPLSVHLFRGAKPILVLLCYGDLDGSGVKQWFRHDPDSNTNTASGAAQNTSVSTRPLPRALPRTNDNWFRVGFFVFLFWYLFVHHQVLRGTDERERYPHTIPQSSDDRYTPPLDEVK